MSAAVIIALVLAAGDARSQLGKLEARKRAEERAARLLAQQERSVLDTLGDAEKALRSASAELRRVEALREGAEARLSSAMDEEAAAQQRVRARLEALRPRLLARERMGRTGALQILLASKSLSDLVKRRYLLERILSRDTELLGYAKAAHDARERARAEREVEANRIRELTLEAEDRRRLAEARKDERETLLAALKGARELRERAAREVREQAKQLAAFVAALPPPRTGVQGPGGFGEKKGRLPPPSPGIVTVGFGHIVNPKFNTVTVQNGIDIAAPRGAPVRAIAPGRVVHAGWFKGYGNLVIVDHGGGYHTLVAHLATMQTAMGEQVDQGTVLGTVGDSGSLKGAYLYFEIREKGRPVDPGPWLSR